jgi:hypothetical protein
VEILAAIGFVRNIIEFVDFSSSLISKTAQLYQSNKGALVEKIDAETATNHLVLLNNKLKDAATATGNRALQNLCKSCSTAAEELLATLDKVKVKGKQRAWESIRKALRSMRSKKEINKLDRQLARFRQELNLHVTADLR